MSIVLFLLFIVLSFLGIAYEKKNSMVLFCVCILILDAIFAFSYANADYDAYEDMYRILDFAYYDVQSLNTMERIGYVHADYGYTLLTKIFYDLGFSYSEFRIILIVLLLTVLAVLAYRMTRKPMAVMFLYAIYPLAIDIIQIRNWVVAVLLALGIYVLIYGRRYQSFKFLCIMGVAATFQKVALVYMPFILFRTLWNNRIGRKICYLFCGIGVLAPLYKDTINYLMGYIFLLVIQTEIGGVKYFEADDHLRLYIAYVCVVACSLVVWFIRSRLGKRIKRTDSDRALREIQIFVMYLLTLSPLYLMARELVRVPRNALYIVYLAVAIYISFIPNRHKQYLAVTVSAICFFIYGYCDFYMGEGVFNVPTIMEHNFLWEWLNL